MRRYYARVLSEKRNYIGKPAKINMENIDMLPKECADKIHITTFLTAHANKRPVHKQGIQPCGHEIIAEIVQFSTIQQYVDSSSTITLSNNV